MYRARIEDTELRFDDHGPGYVVRGPRTDVGYVVLPPGKDFPNHYHETLEELFYTISGSVTLWVDCAERVRLEPGDFIRCDPLEMHYFVNEGTEPWKALFVKSPFAPTDGVVVDWLPGEPAPRAAER